MSLTLIASAWLMGFLGSSHCIVMCGGVVATACTALSLRKPERPAPQVRFALAFNGGRITSYAIAGAVAGSIGAAAGSTGIFGESRLVLRVVAGIVMLLVGLYVAGVGGALKWVERAGRPVWQRLQPWALRLVSIRTVPATFGLGLLWGGMPCGLVFAALAAAVTSGSPLAGAMTMTAFGLGTLPMLLVMGSAAAVVARGSRVRWIRSTAGVALVAFAIVHLAHTGQAWAASRSEPTPVCCAGHRH